MLDSPVFSPVPTASAKAAPGPCEPTSSWAVPPRSQNVTTLWLSKRIDGLGRIVVLNVVNRTQRVVCPSMNWKLKRSDVERDATRVSTPVVLPATRFADVDPEKLGSWNITSVPAP